jgi:hypothetical protein
VRGVGSGAHAAHGDAPWSVKTTGLPLLWPMVGYNGGGRGDSAGAQEGISGRRRCWTGCSGGQGWRAGTKVRAQAATMGLAAAATGSRQGSRGR